MYARRARRAKDVVEEAIKMEAVWAAKAAKIPEMQKFVDEVDAMYIKVPEEVAEKKREAQAREDERMRQEARKKRKVEDARKAQEAQARKEKEEEDARQALIECKRVMYDDDSTDSDDYNARESVDRRRARKASQREQEFYAIAHREPSEAMLKWRREKAARIKQRLERRTLRAQQRPTCWLT